MTMAPGGAQAADRHTLRVTHFAQWAHLFDDDVSLVLHDRTPSVELERAAERLAHGEADVMRAVLAPGRDDPSALLRAFEPCLQRDAAPIAEDLITLAQVLCDLVGADEVGVRMARTNRPMCPAFHVDRVLVRVVVAYRGPGSDFLHPTDVERVTDVHVRMREGATVHSVPTYAAALMKGEGWPGHAGRGLVHRSPHVAAQAPRLVATLDPLA